MSEGDEALAGSRPIPFWTCACTLESNQARVGGSITGSDDDRIVLHCGGEVSIKKIGFAVIYRWRIRSGLEEQFQRAWATATESFMAERGALGSRLHQASDGAWVAYAQWPSRKAWEVSRELGQVDSRAGALMTDAIAESFEPILLTPVQDYLVSE